jgi:HEAT repeat protein
MESAIPALGHLLKHNDEQVRTAAWQALESVGTNAALAALYGDHGSGRIR